MDTQDTNIQTPEVVTPVQADVTSTQPAGDRPFERRRDFSHGDRKKNPRKTTRKEPRVRPEFDNKMVSIRRVARVVAGGRRFSFSVTLVAGNRKGMVGVGQGKAGETPIAIEKALRDAKKNMVQVRTTKDMSIPHEVSAKYGGSRVVMIPAPGRGVLAGSSVRTVLELAGITSINAKLLSGTKNRANNAKVAVLALANLSKTQGKKVK